MLSDTRPNGWSGGQPISLSEIQAFCEMFEINSPDFKMTLTKSVIAMDSEMRSKKDGET